MKVGVVGLGLIGGSLLRALGGVGYDADPGVRSEAAADGFDVVDSLDRLAGCELILVAVPPGVTYGVVDQVLAAVPDAMVADTASVKGDGAGARSGFVVRAPDGGRRDERAGRPRRPAMLRGATWAVCPSDDGAGAAGQARRGGRRARRPASSPARAGEHDEAVARASHVPHLVAPGARPPRADGGLPAALAGTGVPRHDARGARRRRRCGRGSWPPTASTATRCSTS